MIDFELLERDGLARRGRFTTPHGAIETPALLPVVHPDPARQPVAPEEMRTRLGLGAVITSAYITWRTPPLRAVAETEGIHRLIRFDGPVMTDSGAFQQHAYGSVEVTPEEILSFQNTIGSDIATVLDVFTEPEDSYEETETALAATSERSRASRQARPGLLAVPVQGGSHADLRARSAATASELGDVLAVGGVVPLMEQYRFPELVRVLVATRPSLSPGRAVHLFGTGHPMTFALAALFGVDLFDSSAYHKFARRGSLMFPDGTVPLDDVRESACHCFLCAETPLTEVARLPPDERERKVAFHNLLVSAEEIGRVRQAIRDGTLWELAERRTAAHPALRAGLREAMANPGVFLPTEPDSRRAFREVGTESTSRPAAVRFRHAVEVYRVGKSNGRSVPRFPLRPEYLRYLPTADRSDLPIEWESPTPFGPVPVELTDLYPSGRTLAWRSSCPGRITGPRRPSRRPSPGRPTRTTSTSSETGPRPGTTARSRACSSGGTGLRSRPGSPRVCAPNAPGGRGGSGRWSGTDNRSSSSGRMGSLGRRSAERPGSTRSFPRPRAGRGPPGCRPVRARRA